MSTTLNTALSGSYTGDRNHSSFGFAVPHMTVSTFRGTFADVTAGVTVSDDGALTVVGVAEVESISVKSPIDLRKHLLSDEFFDAAQYPRMRFRSAPAKPAEDGSITFDGELTIKNITRPVVVTGTLVGPVEDPYGDTRAALELETKIDRRDYGMNWNMPLPKGGVALGTEVTITVHLELIAD